MLGVVVCLQTAICRVEVRNKTNKHWENVVRRMMCTKRMRGSWNMFAFNDSQGDEVERVEEHTPYTQNITIIWEVILLLTNWINKNWMNQTNVVCAMELEQIVFFRFAWRKISQCVFWIPDHRTADFSLAYSWRPEARNKF